MSQQTTATLTAIFSEVLANLAFMFNDEAEYQIPEDARWLETTISYGGTTSGTLRLECTREFSVLLAANLLGVDPQDDDAESKAEDAVKEFMNVICGQFITATHGTEDVFDLTIPEIKESPTPPEFGVLSASDESILSIEGHVVRLDYRQAV